MMKINFKQMRNAAGGGLMLLVLVNPVLARVSAREPQERQQGRTFYICPMDPEIRSAISGKCPTCGMDMKAADESELKSLENMPALVTRRDGAIEGMRIPDVPVMDQDGRHLRFFTDLVKGRTVAINFMFTTCTTICPTLAVTFAGVQRELGADVSKEILLISVSVDPATDVPPRMKAYLSKFGARPGWVFVGGAKADIDVLIRSLGAYVNDKNDHTPMVLIGNEKAKFWTRVFGLAPAPRLAGLINEARQKVREE